MYNKNRQMLWAKLMAITAVLGLLVVIVGFGATTYNEAPILKTMVEKGKLPPVEERLPKDPAVVQVRDSIGTYGGTATIFDPNPGELGTLTQLAYQGASLWREKYNPETNRVTFQPTYAKNIEVKDDLTGLTVTLREGVKWSDGVELTADDFVFAYEDIALNPDLNPGVAANPEEHGFKVEKLGKYQLKYTFFKPEPNWQDAYDSALGVLPLPKHFFKDFHPDYVGKVQANKIALEAGFDSWVELFEFLNYAERRVQINGNFPPTLGSYVNTQVTSQRLVFERNPYYWKVDNAGNQLPYIDRIVIDNVANREMVIGKVIDGQSTWQSRFLSFSDMPVLKKYEDRANYKVVNASTANPGIYVWFNLTPPDPGLEEVFSDKRFRQAASLALDREQINEGAYFGALEPYQSTVPPNSPYYKEEYAKAYTENDPERATQLLKDMGCTKKGGQWYRPDGKKLGWVQQYVPATPGAAEMEKVMEIVVKQWQDFGFDVTLKPSDQERLRSMVWAGDKLDAGAWVNDFLGTDVWMTRGMDTARLAPTKFSHRWLEGHWGLYNKWYVTGGEEGREPTELIERLNELWNKASKATDFETRKEYAQEILDIHAEQLFTIGFVGPKVQPLIYDRRMRNVPEKPFYNCCAYYEIYENGQFYLEGATPLTEEEMRIDDIYPDDVKAPWLERAKREGWI